MKRLFKVFFVVYIAVYLALSGCIALYISSKIGSTFSHKSNSHELVYLNLGKMPEDTAFTDVLAKGHWEKIKHTQIDYEHLLGVDHSCEIAQYNENDYKSLMFNASFYYTGDRIDLSQTHNKICFEDWSSLFKNFSYIKVAYCDREGNILGVTEEKYIIPVFLREVSYELYADDEELSYKIGTERPFRDDKLWILFIVMTILGVVYIIRFRHRKKKLIQSEKTANKRKE